jgi:hypothetical protein
MENSLATAMGALRKAGAQNLPNAEDVKNAENGKFWSGPKKDGSLWVLTKNNSTSFNVTC